MMASLTLSLQQLCKHGITPEEMLAYVEELDEFGLKMNMQAKHPDELQLLQQMATRKRAKQHLADQRQFLALIALGSIGALGSIVWGLSMM